MNKRGIELSVNFLVIIILGIVILAGGITLIYKVFAGSTQLTDRVSDQQAAELDRIMSQGQLVATATTTKTIKRGDFDIFAIGINNEIGEDMDFYVRLNTTVPNDLGASFSIAGGKTLLNPGPLTIKNNAYEHIGIGISVPKNVSRGTYILGVNVCNSTIGPADCDQYGSPKRLYVVVP